MAEGALCYAGSKGEFLVKSLCRKLRRYLKKNTRVNIRYKCKYLSFLCSTKDPIPSDQRSSIIYEIQCPGCGEKYVGKTDCCLLTRMTEHGYLSLTEVRLAPSFSYV